MEAKTFEEVYAQIMDEWTANPDLPIDEFLSKKLKEAGVSEENKAEYETASKSIDRISENMKEIDVAADNGFTPMEWLKIKLKRLVRSKSDDKEEQDAMIKVYDKCFSKLMEQDIENAMADTQNN